MTGAGAVVSSTVAWNANNKYRNSVSALDEVLREISRLNKEREGVLKALERYGVQENTTQEKVREEQPVFSNEEEAVRWVMENSEDVGEVLGTYESVKELQGDTPLPRWQQELQGIKINPESFYKEGDRNLATPEFKRGWLSKGGRNIDEVAHDLSNYGVEVTPQDVVDFMLEHPSGKVRQRSSELDELGKRFSELATKAAGVKIGKPDSPTGKLFIENMRTSNNMEQLRSQINDAQRAEEEVLKSMAEQRDAERGRDIADGMEVDENGFPFVKSSNGTTVFGEIRENSGLTPAPIKLSDGFQTKDGKGYGLKHIEANHGEQIRNAGFASVEDFVSYVAQNYDEDNIRVGKRRSNGMPSYLLQITDIHDNTLFIEMSKDGTYWNVNSAGIFRKGYSDKKETVVKTEPQQPNDAIPDGSSRSKDNNNGTLSSVPNGKPTVSNNKDTESFSETQEEGNKSGSPLFREVGNEYTPEEQEIIDRAKEDGSYMKAPNGKPSNLNDKQWAQVRTKAFKDWFGDWENDPQSASKVLDENGEPRVVFHGTTNDKETRVWNERSKLYDTTHEPFTVFKRKVDRENNSGHFFNSDKDNAYGYGYNTYDTYLSLQNPLVIDCKGANYSSINYNGEVKDTYEWAKYAEKNGYDGVIFENVRDGVDYGDLDSPTTDYVAFKSNQIKSATDNTGEFSKENADIRFRNIEDVNRRFNEELEGLTEENADRVILYCGNPSGSLLRAGIPDRNIALYGNKLLKKAKGHGYDISDVKNLPNYIQSPIAIFKGSYNGSFAILTEMPINGKNTLVSIDVKKGEIQDLNLVTSIFDKNNKGIIDWINNGRLLFEDKEKALNYLSSSAPIADATNNSELDSATNIVEKFENPTLLEGEILSTIDELSDELDVKVNKVKSRKDLPEGIQRQMKNGRYPGLFDPKTGKVYMVMDEITDVADAQATVLHEIVGHKGIRGLFGDKIGEFAKRVLDSMPEAERRKWVEKYKGDEQLAAEEYNICNNFISNNVVSNKRVVYLCRRNIFEELWKINLLYSVSPHRGIILRTERRKLHVYY